MRGDSRGQAIAEFVIVTPILLILFMAIVDGGRLLFSYVALAEAAQEGALYAAHEPAPVSTVVTRVQTSSNADEVTGAAVTFACTTSPSPGTVTVEASTTVGPLTPIGLQVLGSAIPMSATVVGTNFKGSC